MDLRFERVRIGKLPIRGQTHQFGVRHVGPDEIGEAFGEFEVIDRPHCADLRIG